LRAVFDDRVIEPEVHALSCAARSFTGDFWFYRQSDDKLRFVLGDVAGKGLAAALLMAMVQEEIDRVATSNCDLLAIVRAIHRTLLPETDGRRFASLVIGDLSREGRLRIVNAGHCLPILKRADGTTEMLPPTGPVVGMIDFADWEVSELVMEPGDSLILYSDGIVEATDATGEELGLVGLSAALREAPRTATDLARYVLDVMRAHRSGRAFEDDSTVMAIVARKPEVEPSLAAAV
jgi:sigma-B regulation protein RsbU (phosphoserine phosphatase)